MDAYISREAQNALEAVLLSSRPEQLDGLLIGHHRGHRLFVEKALVTGPGLFSSFDKYLEAAQRFPGEVIGFFTFSDDGHTSKKILAPFAYGRLFLRIETESDRIIRIHSSLVEFEKDFYLKPIPLRGQKKSRK